MKFLKLCFLLGLVGVVSISGTRTTSSNSTSYVDPSFSVSQAPRIILVSVENARLKEQEALESGLVTAFGEAGLHVQEGKSIYLPTRTYTDAEKRDLAIKTKSEAVLVVVPVEKDVREVYTQPDEFGYGHDPFYRSRFRNSYYGSPYGYAYRDPYRSSYGPRTSVGIFGGSRSGVSLGVGFPLGRGDSLYREPVATYKTELYLLPKFEKVWVAEFIIRGPDGMSWSRLASRLGEVVLKKMDEDGVVAPRLSALVAPL